MNVSSVAGRLVFPTAAVYCATKFAVIGLTQADGGSGDVDILNFALNLEYLEAEFYLRAAFGTGLTSGQTSGQGSRGDVTGGRKVSFKSAAIREYAAGSKATIHYTRDGGQHSAEVTVGASEG